jgi:hypothetical protein
MKYRKLTLVYLFIIIISFSCEKITLKDCISYTEQKWFLGNFEAELETKKQIVNIGDTIKFTFKIDKNLIDINNKSLNIDKGIKILNRFSLNENSGVTVGKSLFENFEDYFDYKIIKGIPESVFTYNCILTKEIWEIEIEYIPKRKGEYIIYLKIFEINSTDLNLDYKECMEGDPNFGAKAIWKENQFNRIKDLYPNNYLNNEFGIIVE